jgi:hypothetical protein
MLPLEVTMETSPLPDGFALPVFGLLVRVGRVGENLSKPGDVCKVYPLPFSFDYDSIRSVEICAAV